MTETFRSDAIMDVLRGLAIKQHRKLDNMRKIELASISGVSLTTIERVERGEPVSLLTLKKIGKALLYEEDAFVYFPFKTGDLTPNEKKKRQKTKVAPLQHENQLINLQEVDILEIDLQRIKFRSENLNHYLGLVGEDLSILVNRANSNGIHQKIFIAQRVVKNINHINWMCKTVALIGKHQAKASLPNEKRKLPIQVAFINFFTKVEDPGAIRRKILYTPRYYNMEKNCPT